MAANYVSLAFPMGESLSESDIEEVYNTGMDTGGLDFSGADLSGDQPYFIADLLSSNKMISIVHIDVSHTKITVEGFEAILFAAMEIKTLESFVGKSLSLPKEAGMSLSKLIASKGCLKILDVSQNDLGDVGLSNLSGAFSADHSKVMTKQLMSVVTLSVLDLSSNNLGDAGVLSLCRGLSQFIRRATSVGVTPALKVLLLHNNNITDKAAICLAQLINFRDNTITLGSTGVISPIPKGGLNNTLHLDELGLNDNPLTARGITALLGYANEGVISPLKRLLLANTAVDVEVLELLGQNLLHNPNTTLTHIDLSVSAQQAAELVQDTANIGTTNGSANTNNYHARRLYSALNQLCTAIVQNNTTLTIQLGFLHRTLYTQAVYLAHSMHESTEIVRTLELLNHPTVATVLGHTVVPNVAHWLRSAEYVHSEYSTAYGNAEHSQYSQVDVPPAADYVSTITTSGYHQNYAGTDNTTSANNNGSLPVYTPSKAHFAFTTDSTHVTENAINNHYNNHNKNITTDTIYHSTPVPMPVPEILNNNNVQDQYSDYPMLYPATTTIRTETEEEEEVFEIETVLKQDACSLMSALRNLSPEGRAALAAPVGNSVGMSSYAATNVTSTASASAGVNEGSLTADSLGESINPTISTNNIATTTSAAPKPLVTLSTTPSTAPIVPPAQYSIPPTLATTSGLTSPVVRKSNFLSTFHGGVLGLLAGSEPPVISSFGFASLSPAGNAVPAVDSVVGSVVDSVIVPTVVSEEKVTYTIPSAVPTVTQSTIAAAPAPIADHISTTPAAVVPPYQYSSDKVNDTYRSSPQTVSHSISNHTELAQTNSSEPTKPTSNPAEYGNTTSHSHSNNPSPEIVGENEFYKLRSDHTVAMRNLSQEIDRLAHISPSTKLLMQSPGASHTQNASVSTPASVPKAEYTCTPENDLYSVYQDAHSTPTLSMQTNPAFDTSRIVTASMKEESSASTLNMPIPTSTYADTSDTTALDANTALNTTSAATTAAPTTVPGSTAAAAAAAAAAAPIDETLMQIIGHLQAKVNSMEASQTLYETSFINKFSTLEYRIECMEQNMQSNSDVLKSIQDTQMQLLERLGNNNSSSVVKKEEKDEAAHGEEKLVENTSTTPTQPSPPSQPPATPHTHYSPLPPSIPNELVFTDLMARLEVVEDRLITDRAAAMQNVLNKQLHQERQQELSVMLGGSGNASGMNSYNSTMHTLNTTGGSINMATVFGLHNSGRRSNGNSPLLAQPSHTPYQPSNSTINSAMQQGPPATSTPVRSPFLASATPGTTMFSPSTMYQGLPGQVGSPQLVPVMYQQPNGSQYSAMHQLSSPVGSTVNTTATPLNTYVPTTLYAQFMNMGYVPQPAPTQVFPPYTPSATSASVPVPTSVPGMDGQSGTLSMPVVQHVNPFVPKPAVYSSTEILQRPVHLQQQPQQQPQPQQQQHQQQASYDPQYTHTQYQQHPPPLASAAASQDHYDDSLSQLAYQEKEHDHTHQVFQPAPTQATNHHLDHYTSNNYPDMADEHSQLTEPNDDIESVAEDSHVHYVDNTVETPYRTEPQQYQHSSGTVNLASDHRRSVEGVATEFTTANQPFYQNQSHTSHTSHSNHPNHSNHEKHYGLNDDHLHNKSESRNHHDVGHLSEETESRAIGTLQRLQDNSFRHNTTSTHAQSHVMRPPIRPTATNDSHHHSHTNGTYKKTTTVSSLSAGSIDSSKPTTRAANTSNDTTNPAKTTSSRAVSSSSHHTDTVLLKHVADRTHASPHSVYIDAGYYQYDFEALSSPLIPLDDRSVQSNVTNDSMKYSIEPYSDGNINRQSTPGHNRLISAHGNNNDGDTSMNYNIINSISRGSMNKPGDNLRDSVDLLRKDVNIQNPHSTRAEPNTRNPERNRNSSSITGNTNETTLANYPNPNGSSSSGVGKSRSKSPHFMRPTTSHAFKAASNRPVEAKVGVEYR